MISEAGATKRGSDFSDPRPHARAREVGLLLYGTFCAEKHALQEGRYGVGCRCCSYRQYLSPTSAWARIDLGKCYEPQHRLPQSLLRAQQGALKPRTRAVPEKVRMAERAGGGKDMSVVDVAVP